MKATIDFDDRLYRRLKIEAARRGRTVRDLVSEGVQRVLEAPLAPAPPAGVSDPPRWFGALHGYAANARGGHDMDAIRASVARGRATHTADKR